MNAVLGPEETKRALDVLSNPQRTTGVYVFFSRSEDVIDSLLYTASFNFPRDVAVCGVCIGMTVDAMREALPEVRLADGETGEPNEHGVVQYRAQPTSLNATLGIGVKNGEVAGISLRRLDMDEVLARRERQEAERKAARDRELDRASRWKSIADPDKMLLDWAKHCSPWTDYSRRDSSRSPVGSWQRPIRMSGTSRQRAGIGTMTTRCRCGSSGKRTAISRRRLKSSSLQSQAIISDGSTTVRLYRLAGSRRVSIFWRRFASDLREASTSDPKSPSMASGICHISIKD